MQQVRRGLERLLGLRRSWRDERACKETKHPRIEGGEPRKRERCREKGWREKSVGSHRGLKARKN